jgi:hypothetical protein
VLLSLREALTLAEIPVPDHLWARDGSQQEPLRALTAALARAVTARKDNVRRAMAMDTPACGEPVPEFVVGLEALKEFCGGWPEPQRLQLWQWLLKRELAVIAQEAAVAEAQRRLAALQQAGEWFTSQGPAFETVLAEPLALLAGGWHQRLVLQKESVEDRTEWFWLAWQVVQWRQQLADAGAEWWPAVQEQLVRLGALAWAEQAEAADLPTPERHEAISRTLTLLKALEPMHQPLPLWIVQLQKQLLVQGIEPLLSAAPPCVEHLEEAAHWMSLLAAGPELELNQPGPNTNRLAAAWQDVGNGLEALGVTQLAQRAWTAAERQVRRSGYRGESRSKPLIRTIHHLACTGGTVISKCVAAMPYVALLSEVNPLNRFGADFEPTNPLLMLERSYRQLSVNEIREVFQKQIAQVVQICVDDGVDLVIRDHSHTDFCIGERPAGLTPIFDFLGAEYELLSALTIRHPLDSYLGLLAQGWEKQFDPSTLSEYASRYHAFLDRYRDLPIFRYEEFCLDPAAFMLNLCEALELEYEPSFSERFGSIRLSGDSGRGSNIEISLRARREVPGSVNDEMASSAAYQDLISRLGYSREV